MSIQHVDRYVFVINIFVGLWLFLLTLVAETTQRNERGKRCLKRCSRWHSSVTRFSCCAIPAISSQVDRRFPCCVVVVSLRGLQRLGFPPRTGSGSTRCFLQGHLHPQPVHRQNTALHLMLRIVHGRMVLKAPYPMVYLVSFIRDGACARLAYTWPHPRAPRLPCAHLPLSAPPPLSLLLP